LREAEEDLMYIQDWDSARRWYPALLAVIETIPAAPTTVYYCTPTGTFKYQPIHHLYDSGIPAFHIVWEERLNGFRPMVLNFDFGVTVVTGIALERADVSIPGMRQVNYDDDNDPQIRRMIVCFNTLSTQN
jgi:hypothetical protein